MELRGGTELHIESADEDESFDILVGDLEFELVDDRLRPPTSCTHYGYCPA
ncbi:hypothetical protein ACWGR4_34705 [Embleya sp. NPDC055664]|uniref:hypothetical protein n=1 Tax=Embleya sp. NPDC059237 TaxID=3346784 RepID=UPI00368833ED